MKASLTRLRVPPLLLILVILLVGLALFWTIPVDSIRTPLDSTLLLQVVLLMGATVLAARFPIHLRHNVKLMVTTVPLFLIVILLPPPLAAFAAGAAMLGAALLLHSQIENTPLDIAITVGRWIINAGVSSMLAHWVTDTTGAALAGMVVAAVAMFFIELVGSGLEIAPMTGETPLYTMKVLLREGGVAEGVQYLIGIGGALAVTYQLWTLLLFVVPTVIVYLTFKRAKEMQESTRLLLEAMADQIDQRDPHTGGHSRRVTELCRAILQTMPLRGPEADLILYAARVHDIGKISVPDELLQKPGPLTPEECHLMQSHVETGARLLERYKDFSRGKEIVLHHHERWDGTGYPSGLGGIEIPLGARIISVADSYDAMTNDRPYRRAYTHEQALRILQEGRGTQWEPRIVDALLQTQPHPLPAQPDSLPLGTIIDSLDAIS